MKIRCIKGSLRGQSFELDDQTENILGREPEPLESTLIELPSMSVSSQHAKIYFENGHYMVKDLNSRNGIRVNRQAVSEAYLSVGDKIDIGEFCFVVEDSKNFEESSITPTPYQLKSEDQLNPEVGRTEGHGYKDKLHVLKKKYERLDFNKKLYISLFIFAILVHSFTVVPFIQESKKRLFKESFQSARQISENLALRYRKELGTQAYHEIDCDVYRNSLLRKNLNIPFVRVLNEEGEVVCPLAESFKKTAFIESALRQSNSLDDCDHLLSLSIEASCSLISPIRFKAEGDSAPLLVGYALIEYIPKDVYIAMKRLQSLRWQTLLISILSLLGFGYIVQRWLFGALEKLKDQVHLLHTGTVQKVDRLPNFAAFQGLIEEVNGLIAKSNQGLKPQSGAGSIEASFLQIILEQVLLLEERAVMAVDNDNHVIGGSELLSEYVPLHDNYLNSHVTEAIADPHLQGELMSFLNDLNDSSEVLERSLSLSDRVIHARGMPLYLKDECVGSLVFFDFG